MRHTIINSSLFILLLLLNSCVESPYYQKEYAVPDYEWAYNEEPTFRIDVSDTNALYSMYFLIRHTEAYPYSNIWLMVQTKKPGDTVYKQTRLEVPLAEPNGKWLGRGMGEIWEQRMPITHEGDTTILNKKGLWEIKLGQVMRVDPLPEILQVGLRIEKKPKP